MASIYTSHHEEVHGGITYQVFVSIAEFAPTIILWDAEGASFKIAGFTDSDALMAMALSIEIVEWVERE